MKIMHLPPAPYFYVGMLKQDPDGNYVIFCDIYKKTSMGSLIEINDYLVNDPDMFKAIGALLESKNEGVNPDKRLPLIYFYYLEAKYPTYSFH